MRLAAPRMALRSAVPPRSARPPMAAPSNGRIISRRPQVDVTRSPRGPRAATPPPPAGRPRTWSLAASSGVEEDGAADGLADWLAEDAEAAALAGVGAAAPPPPVEAAPADGYTRVFVANVAWDTTADILRAHFEATCGPVADVGLPLRPDGRPKGFAFVEFADAGAAATAVAQASCLLDGRELVVEPATGERTSGRRGGEQ